MAKNVYVKSVLTGGGSDALDGIPYNSIQDGEFCFTLYKNQRFFVHYFDASSSASESVPDVIAPDDVGSNYGRWLLAASRTKICDEDRDTCFETERSADQDMIRAKAGGQDIFYAYSSGIFTFSKQSASAMHLSAAQSIPSGAWTKVNFDASWFDVQSEIDLTNHRWTATKWGRYFIRAVAQFAQNSTGFRGIRIMRNGSYLGLSLMEKDGDSSAATFLQTAIVWAYNAGDYLEVQVYQNSGGDLNLVGCSVEIIKVI